MKYGWKNSAPGKTGSSILLYKQAMQTLARTHSEPANINSQGQEGTPGVVDKSPDRSSCEPLTGSFVLSCFLPSRNNMALLIVLLRRYPRRSNLEWVTARAGNIRH